MASPFLIPFSPNQELFHHLPDHSPTITNDLRLPGHSSRHLSDTNLARFLINDIGTSELDSVAPRLWILTTYYYGNINPLHAQQIRDRSIVIAEHPRLHLTWKHGRIFIKPLPKYLLSYNFWRLYLVDDASPIAKADREAIVRAAKGLLRSYYCLIKHETDFELAQNHSLISRHVTWDQFSEFLTGIASITSAEVSPRYHYGEIRLSRLNLYAPFLFKRANYEWGRPQYSQYFNRFYGHILFVWAAVSLLLNSLQVTLAAEALIVDHWIGTWYMSRYFSLLCFAATGIMTLTVLCTLIAMICREWMYAVRAAKQVHKSLAL